MDTSSIVSLDHCRGPAAPQVAGVEEGGTPAPAPQPEAAHRLAQGDGVGAGLLHVTPRHSGLVTVVTGHESGNIILGSCLFRGQTITEVNQNWDENISHSKISQKESESIILVAERRPTEITILGGWRIKRMF